MNRKSRGTVRIIGGRWRGTRLKVPDLPGLRPSGDRSRETLFNWLQPFIHGARCADLFAGSGALGLEAASRGASDVVLIEKSPKAAAEIQQVITRLDTDTVRCVQGDALAWLQQAKAQSLDIVFLDPPFGSGLDAVALSLLEQGNLQPSGGFLYLESPRARSAVVPGSGWEVHRDKVLGDVHMQLFKKIQSV